MLVSLVRCNNCMEIFEDTNPSLNNPMYEVTDGTFRQLDGFEVEGGEDSEWGNHCCPNCETDWFLMDDFSDDRLRGLEIVYPERGYNIIDG